MLHGFHPNTSVSLRDGRVVAIKDLAVGDVLNDDTICERITYMRNRYHEPLYALPGNILVSGNHRLLIDGKQSTVSASPDAVPQPLVVPVWIDVETDGRQLRLGAYVFLASA